MFRRYSFPLIATLCGLYLLWRTAMTITYSTTLAWALLSIEAITLLELTTICYIYTRSHKTPRKKTQHQAYSASAIIDGRNASQDEILLSVYSLQESPEFSQIHIIPSNTSDIDTLISKNPKAQIFDPKNQISTDVVAWIHAGDVVLEDFVEQVSSHFSPDVPLVVPSSSLWSNTINNANTPKELDEVSIAASTFLSHRSGEVWAGESALFTRDFFSEHVLALCTDHNIFTQTNKSLTQNNQKGRIIETVVVEQHDMNSRSYISKRMNETRLGWSSLSYRRSGSRKLLATLRFISRPIRSLRVLALGIVAIVATLTSSIPFPAHVAVVLGSITFYVGIYFIASKTTKLPFDSLSRIRHGLNNVGADISSLFTTNPTVGRWTNQYVAPAITICVALSLVVRWFIDEFIKDLRGSSLSMLFAVSVLGILVFGLEMVGIRQRRFGLRRIINVNAHFGCRLIEIADLSPDDCGVISRRPIDIGHEETIKLAIPHRDSIQKLSLDARAVNSTKVGAHYRVGFVFENISEEDKAILVRFCTLTYPLYTQIGLTNISGDSRATDITLSKKTKKSDSLTFLRNGAQRPLVRVAAIIALFAVTFSNLPPYKNAQAATTSGPAKIVSGIVYNDFNANGVNDPGDSSSATDTRLAGVKVIASCVSGTTTTSGTSVTNSAGEFLIGNLEGSCRVEISPNDIPVGYESTAIGNDSDTLVQFHNTGTANIMFGLHQPGAYCQNNPDIVVACFGRGSSDVLPTNKGALLQSTWKGDTYTNRALWSQVGTVNGIAYNKETNDVYAAAYLRRKTAFGPLGIDGIYTVSKNNTVTPFIKLSQLGENVGADPHTTGTDLANRDFETHKYVGRRGIGDIDISPDNKTLYATNLNTSTVIGINTATKQATNKLKISGPLTTSNGRTCAQSDIRIFGLGVKPNGDVYIGAVCSAESTKNRADLYYYVLKTNAALTSTPLVVSSGDLNYERDTASQTVIKWNPWTWYPDDVVYNTIPFPSVSDIIFVGNDLVIGMRDIAADASPKNDVFPAQESSAWGAVHGDVVRLCNTGTDKYTMESNRTCPDGRKASSAVPQPIDEVGAIGGRGSNGPGGGEWFVGDDPIDGFAEGTLGSLAHASGFKEFASTQIDPKIFYWNKGKRNDSIVSAGVRWFNSESGTDTHSNLIYTRDDLDWSFAKANGLGDLEVLCNGAPIEIGNRVWSDDNADGIQDPNEAGISGVSVELLNSTGSVVSTQTTNANGEYKFTNIDRDKTYTVRVVRSSLNSYEPAPVNVGRNDSIDADGVIDPTYVSASVPVLTAGQNNHTFDFGFIPLYAAGNLVFEDKNNNGIQDNGEPGVGGVKVRLLDKNNNAIAGQETTTDASGNYYFFHLRSGSYALEIVAPSGYISSTGKNGSSSGPYEPAPSAQSTPKIDSDDNGTTQGSVIRSSQFSLGFPTVRGEAQGTTVHPPDIRNDYTIDFGIFKPGSIGDYVWSDTDNNSKQDAGEPPVSGVSVSLYLNACSDNGVLVATTSTDANGKYMFEKLVAGNYFVKFQLPNGASFTQPLAGTDRAIDSDANIDTGCSNKVVLPYAGNDITIDAGISTPQLSLGNRVFLDSNQNGKDDDEPAIPGATVELFKGTSKVGTTTTDANGHYLFTNLVGGQYSVRVTAPTADYRSTTPDATNPDNDIDRDDNGIGTGHIATSGIVTLEIGKEPTDERNLPSFVDSTPNKNSNHSVDFGFIVPIDLQITKDVVNKKQGGYLPGDSVQYSLTVKNNGPANARVGYTVTDVLPSQLSFVESSISAAGFSCSVDNKTLTCTAQQGLAKAETRTITYTATINTNLSSSVQSLRNVATITPHKDDVIETVPLNNCDAVGNGTSPSLTCNNRDNEVITIQAGATLGDYLWFDANHNGSQDNGESGVADMKVSLHENSCASAEIASTKTDATGLYLFGNLTPGKTYFVKFTRPDSMVFTQSFVGSNPAIDSNADPQTGCSNGVVLGSGEQNLTIDAGVYLPWASIGDFVWHDLNRNGLQDNGEKGVAGVSVALLNSTGTTVATTTTNAQGLYQFDSLVPGDYSISFTLPSGYKISPINVGTNRAIDSDGDTTTGRTVKTTLSPGEKDLSWDLGIYLIPAAIGDYVWYDDNHNGIQDNGEKPVVDVMVMLMKDSCTTEVSRVKTDKDGKYIFDGLEPGTYSIRFVLPDGSSFTLANIGNDATDSDAGPDGCTGNVTLTPGERNMNIDAGVVVLSSVGDFVWNDKNRNGIQDDGEKGVAGIHVYLLDKDGKRKSNKRLVTDQDGKYLFAGLLPGTYAVEFDLSTLPVGYQVSPHKQGKDNALDSDGDVDTGITQSVTLGANERNLTLDLGINIIPASLSDFVFNDENRNGIQDENEPGIPGVIVELFMCEASVNDEPLETTTSDEDGFYEFVNLEPGSYFVRFTTPDGMVITQQYSGDNSDLDSNVNIDGTTACVELAPGDNDPTIDAGFYTPDEPPVQVLPNRITRQLPFTGSMATQIAAFALSLIGAGILLAGFFRKRTKQLKFY